MDTVANRRQKDSKIRLGTNAATCFAFQLPNLSRNAMDFV